MFRFRAAFDLAQKLQAIVLCVKLMIVSFREAKVHLSEESSLHLVQNGFAPLIQSEATQS